MFFEKFSKGVSNRMGRDIGLNAGLSHKVLMKMMNKVEKDLKEGELRAEEKRFTLICIFTAQYAMVLH